MVMFVRLRDKGGAGVEFTHATHGVRRLDGILLEGMPDQVSPWKPNTYNDETLCGIEIVHADEFTDKPSADRYCGRCAQVIPYDIILDEPVATWW